MVNLGGGVLVVVSVAESLYETLPTLHSLSSFVVIKVIIGVNLVSYAIRRQAGMEARKAEDAVNDFGRDPIGEGKEEQACIIGFTRLLNINF
jgi:hypothetical protein